MEGCNCGCCPIEIINCSLKEPRELKLIEDGLQFEQDHWIAKYPRIKDPNDLKDNRSPAYQVLLSTEKRLSKNPIQAKVNCEQIIDMINREVARKLTENGMRSYNGPVHYISHHEVLKPESPSTPCHIEFNSPAKFQDRF